MADASQNFTKLVPGFDFLQGLVKNAGSALPAIGQWVAPTLDPQELEKRIEELRTVQFWLEQNARMLAATIQALEVQRMTLSTLRTMNVPLQELRESIKAREPAPAPRPAAPAAPAAPIPAAEPPAAKALPTPRAAPAEKAPPAVDPMQWWGALTKQFTELAANAMKGTGGEAAQALAGSIVKQGFDAAKTLGKAAATPAKAAGAAGKTAAKRVAKAAPKGASAPAARKRSPRR